MKNVQMDFEESGRKRVRWIHMILGRTVWRAKYIKTHFRLILSLLNPLNPELNPICYLLALLAHHFLHVSRIMVIALTLRLLM